MNRRRRRRFFAMSSSKETCISAPGLFLLPPPLLSPLLFHRKLTRCALLIDSDLLRKSADGFSYFADRLGDTYRWMSENVATTQVASVLGHLIPNPNVYGVLVPGYDGRAGCVGIETPSEGGEGSKIDLAQIAMAARKGLPKYAVPLFIRFVARMESTGTQKQQKVALRNEGIDPAKHGDPIYWLQGGKYVRFTEKDWSNLKDGKVRL